MDIGTLTASLLVISILTSLATEGIKAILDSKDRSYSANVVAGAVAVVLSAAYGAGYVIITGTAWNAALIVYLIALVILSWLCAMVGYDKVKQAIEQMTSGD